MEWRRLSFSFLFGRDAQRVEYKGEFDTVRI